MIKKLSLSVYLLSLFLPAFSTLGSGIRTVYGIEALLLGALQVFVASFMLFTQFDVAAQLMLPWIANVTWFVCLVIRHEKSMTIFSALSIIGVVTFFSYPLAMIGETATVASLDLHVGAYLWGLALSIPSFGNIYHRLSQ